MESIIEEKELDKIKEQIINLVELAFYLGKQAQIKQSLKTFKITIKE